MQHGGAWRDGGASAGEAYPTAAGVTLRRWSRPNVTVFGVPYSEHSSFTELRECVQFLDPVRIVPTVRCCVAVQCPVCSLVGAVDGVPLLTPRVASRRCVQVNCKSSADSAHITHLLRAPVEAL